MIYFFPVQDVNGTRFAKQNVPSENSNSNQYILIFSLYVMTIKPKQFFSLCLKFVKMIVQCRILF